MKIIRIKNYRRGFATNSSSTHSVLFKNEGEMINDLNVFSLNYYDRMDRIIASTRSAKIKYICAAIYHVPTLLEIMMGLYPEMKQYLPLINLQREKVFRDSEEETLDNDVFGMYSRERLYFEDVICLEANVEYLKKVIEDPSIMIVGGSDEEDFVWDHISSHEEFASPDDCRTRMGDERTPAIIKNGNYWVGFDYVSGNRLRFVTGIEDRQCVPEYPELVDLKITDRCEHNCPFCYQGSVNSGRHASLDRVLYIISRFTGYRMYHPYFVEFAIGGGNVLLHPDLEKILHYIYNNGHIANVTLNVKDIPTLVDMNKPYAAMFSKYVRGLGISVSSLKEVEIFKQLVDSTDIMKNRGLEPILSKCKVIIHLIPEMLGLEATKDIMSAIRDRGFHSYLLLGYKSNNRGANQPWHKLSDEALDALFDIDSSFGVDTTFANRYKNYLVTNRPLTVEKTITFREGEFSMYIDAVHGKAYKSSYQLDNPYSLFGPEGNHLSIQEAFNAIRQDNGLPTFIERK